MLISTLHDIIIKISTYFTCGSSTIQICKDFFNKVLGLSAKVKTFAGRSCMPGHLNGGTQTERGQNDGNGKRV